VKNYLFPKLTTNRRQKLREFLESKFEELYQRAEVVLRKHNPCAITRHKGKVYCAGCPAKQPEWIYSGGVYPNALCCGGCKFHTDKGCVAEKPLTCKLWLCATATRLFPQCEAELQKINNEASGWNLCVLRGDKTMSLQHAYRFWNIPDATGFISMQRLTFIKTLID